MAEPNDIGARLSDAVVEAGLVAADRIAEARSAASERGVSVGAVLLERGLLTPEQVAAVLERDLGIPRVELSSYAPEPAALAVMPAELAAAHRILPLFEIDGILTVAMGEAMDVFALEALSAEVGMELEPVLAEAAEVAAAVRQYYGAGAMEPDSGGTPVAEGGSGGAPAEGTEVAAPRDAPVEAEDDGHGGPVVPAIDLDVLAVADARRAAVLATEILEHAAAAGAEAIHLVPYKDDFFLVYRVRGVLERIASAPISLGGPLVEAFRSIARMPAAAPSLPAHGRARIRLENRDAVLSASIAPTIAGQRLVMTLDAADRRPTTLEALGMSDAEVRAVKAMLERGRGLLLIAAPAGHGASATYYAALGHASGVGRSVFSVERSIEFEIPAVAQTLADPASPVGASALMAAGLGQDTDVLAMQTLISSEELRLAVEASTAGKLVIVTIDAADIAQAVRRMLDLGAEPHGLAAVLTLGVAQRYARTNCPNCTLEVPSAQIGRIPGVPADAVNMAGTGCPNCAKTGFRGLTGLFEVLPFTEPVRAAVASASSAAVVGAAAVAAGMRPLVSAGLAQVLAGRVSADELDRVLRFSTPESV